MSIVAVGFDLDYTLAVPDRDREAILREATVAADAPALSREAYLEAHADNLTAETREPIFRRLLAERETDADPQRLARAYRERLAEALVPVEGAAGLVEDLRGRYRVGVLTNGPVRAQRHKLETLGWTDAFDALLVTGELEAGKPDRRAFEALLDALDATPEETVYVGDDPVSDVEGATGAGIRAIQVLYDGGPEPHPAAVAHVRQDELVARLPELLRSLSA